MNRPARIWILFGLCLALGTVAMIWITRTTLAMERTELQSRRDAAVEEKVRLALWRMDAALAPLIVQESGRPYFQFNAFFPAGRIYARGDVNGAAADALIPSPLLFTESPHVLLYFQIDPEGRFTSPQVPKASQQGQARRTGARPEQIQTAKTRLTRLSTLLDRGSLRAQLASGNGARRWPTQAPLMAQGNDPSPEPPKNDPSGDPKRKLALNAVTQQLMNTQEFRARSSQQIHTKSQGEQIAVPPQIAQIAGPDRAVSAQEGSIQPLWFGADLVLVRQVRIDGRDYIQGSWLDWPGIKAWLKTTVVDLLPNADFVGISPEDLEEGGRLMAALPVRLVPGPLPGTTSEEMYSSIRLSLLFAWCCALIAGTSAAVVLWRTIQLSERRGAFVSAVTHELRTPLTTFKLYTELLVLDMVQDQDERKSFLATLMSEANRLDHLVKNVLAYARLESRRSPARMGTLTLAELLEHHQARLVQRAEQGSLTLRIEAPEEGLKLLVRTDPSVVEQILFNLVDNACKYALPAEDRTLHLEVSQQRREALLQVRDHGPGITRTQRRKLFEPFSKSAREAAHSAPGVGLGLALSRNLARSLGGELEYVPTSEGACFRLRLPLA